MAALQGDPWAFGWNQIISILNLAAVTIGILVARNSIKKWQVERVASRQCEIAEQAIALMYEARLVFSSIRNLGYAGAVPPIILERLQAHSAYWDRIFKVRIDVEIYFGPEAVGHLNKILMIRERILLAAVTIKTKDARLRMRTDDAQREKLIEEVGGLENFLFDQSPNNSIDKDLDQATRKIEEILLPIIRKFKRRP